MQKLPRIVRLDASDSEVYTLAAEPGEWAVAGSFHFWDADPTQLSGKYRQAFVHGFLGTESFGWASLVAVAEPTPFDIELICQRLARHLVEQFDAPSIDAALPAAREELAFAGGLCEEHPVQTLLAVQRTFSGDEIQESYRVVRLPDGADHDSLRLWGPQP